MQAWLRPSPVPPRRQLDDGVSSLRQQLLAQEALLRARARDVERLTRQLEASGGASAAELKELHDQVAQLQGDLAMVRDGCHGDAGEGGTPHSLPGCALLHATCTVLCLRNACRRGPRPWLPTRRRAPRTQR